MGRSGLLDEYYPGERSFPGTVFAAYATLKSAVLLDQSEIIEHPALRACAENFLARGPSAASNQDVGAAAFLALYSKATGRNSDRVRERVGRFLAGADGNHRFLEYGGFDPGYATVTLNYLAHMDLDGSFEVADHIVALAGRIRNFISAGGVLGGEYASRSTTYFLPFGLLRASFLDAGLTDRFACLDLARCFAKFDDRYLMHYTVPSLAASIALLRQQAFPHDIAAVKTEENGDFSVFDEFGLASFHRGASSVFVALNKGGSCYLESGGDALIDTGYGVKCDGRCYYSNVLSDADEKEISVDDDRIRIVLKSGFRKYAVLTASPMKTIVLRILAVAGPTLNKLFKRLLIQKADSLEGTRLIRTFVMDRRRGSVEIIDEVEGLVAGRTLIRTAAVSPRLVPSAKFHQSGEERAHARSGSIAAGELPLRQEFRLS